MDRRYFIRVGGSAAALAARASALAGAALPPGGGGGGDGAVTLADAVAARGWLAAHGHAAAVLCDVVVHDMGADMDAAAGGVVCRLRYTNNGHWVDVSGENWADADDLTR